MKLPRPVLECRVPRSQRTPVTSSDGAAVRSAGLPRAACTAMKDQSEAGDLRGIDTYKCQRSRNRYCHVHDSGLNSSSTR
jgi:hypothetical protein